jgi:Flp pilus assembly pilin Flp
MGSTVKVVFIGDSSNLRKSLGDIDDAASRTSGRFSGMAKQAVAGLGVAGVAAAGAFIHFGKLGNQLDALGKKSATVFEGQIGDVKAWADANAKAFGLTSKQLTGLAAGFGDLLKPMGFTAQQAAAMSKDVVGLSGALSAWSGGTKSAAEVSDILAKAMLGERDALKGLGIAISEADVQARLAKKGQEDLTGAALEQAKAIATQELIFEKSTDAQKAWADGSMDAIKAQNGVKASLGELQEQLATRLQPAFEALTKWLVGTGLPAFDALTGWIGDKLGPKVGWLADEVKSLAAIFGEFGINVHAVGLVLGNLAGDVLTAFGVSGDTAMEWSGRVRDAFWAVSDAAKGAFGWLRDNVPQIMAVVIDALKSVKTWVEENWGVVQEKVTGAFQGIKDWVDTRWQEVADAIGTGSDKITAKLDETTANAEENKTGWGKAFDAMKTASIDWASGTIRALQLAQDGLRAMRQVADFEFGVAKALWDKFGDDIQIATRGAWGGVLDIVRAHSTALSAHTTLLKGLITGDIGEMWDGIKKEFVGGFQLVEGLAKGGWAAVRFQFEDGARAVWRVVTGAIDDYIVGPFKRANLWLIDAGKAIMKGLLDGLMIGWDDVKGWVGKVGGWIKDLKGPIEADAVLLYPEGQAIMTGLGEGMADGWEPVEAWVGGLADRIKPSLDDLVAYMNGTIVNGAMEAAARAANIMRGAEVGAGSGATAAVASGSTVDPYLASVDSIINRAVNGGGASTAVMNVNVNSPTFSNQSSINALSYSLQKQFAVAFAGAA